MSEQTSKLEIVGDQEAADDVIVSFNLTRLIERLIRWEETIRADRREEADRLFVKRLATEVFGNDE